MCLLALFSFYSANRRRKVNYIVQLKRSNTNFSVAKYQGKKQKWLDTFDWIETTVELPHEIARARPPKASIIMDTRRPFKAALADACGIDDILKDLHEKKLAEDARTGKDLKGSCVCLRFRGLCKQADISGLSRPKAYWLKLYFDAWVKKL